MDTTPPTRKTRPETAPQETRLQAVARNVCATLGDFIATPGDPGMAETVRTAGLRLLEAYHQATLAEAADRFLASWEAGDLGHDLSDALREEADLLATYTADNLAALVGTNSLLEAFQELDDLGLRTSELDETKLGFAVYSADLLAALKARGLKEA